LIREVTGFNGQVVTTWGRDLEGDTWVGKPKPLETHVTCRCGNETRYSGFPSQALTSGEGWTLFLKEWFCKPRCVREYRGLEAKMEAEKVDLAHERHLAWYIQASRDLRGPL